MRTTVAISTLPALTTAQALQDAWLAVIVALILGALFIFLIGRLALNFSDKSMVQYSQELLGVWPGKFLSLFYPGLFLFMGATDLRIYGEVIRAIFLPETPLIIILGSMVIVSLMVVYAGLEPLGRMADLILPVFILSVLFTLLFPLMEADFGNLRPVLYHGWQPVLFAALTPAAVVAQYANLAILVPSVVEPRKTLRAALSSLVWASFVLVLIVVIVVAVLGSEEGAHAFFPVFKMIRAIRVSEFLERIEFFPTFAWGLGLFITLAVNLYSLAKGLSQFASLRDHRPLFLPLAIILSTLSVQGYSDVLELRRFFQPQIAAPFLCFFLLFPVVILWGAYFLKGGKNSVSPTEKK